MDDIPILGNCEDRKLRNEFLRHYDAPAYVRRARGVQDALDQLLGRCRRQRDEWLSMTRLRLGFLHALAGDWCVLRPWLAGEDQEKALRQLHGELSPRLRMPVEPTSSGRALRRALRELNESIERFNRRWQTFLQGVDLTPVNELREGYNRYYLLEKECALRSSHVARLGFSPLRPLTPGDLLAALPPLPLPRLK